MHDDVMNYLPSCDLESDDKITSADFLVEMNKLVNAYGEDAERFHFEADELLCEVLESLGYELGVQMFREKEKWYS